MFARVQVELIKLNKNVLTTLQKTMIIIEILNKKISELMQMNAVG